MELHFGTITWKTVWYYILNLNIFYDPAVLIPGIHPEKNMHISNERHAQGYLETLFTITPKWK